MSGKTREQQLDELLDKQAIYELIMAYCNAADRHDHVKMRTLYHEDAIDDHGHFAKGLAMEFIDKLPEIQKAMEILHHNVTTVNLKLAGDRAEGEVGYRKFNRPFFASLAGRKRPRKRRFGHRSGTDRGFMRGFSTSRGHAAAQCVAISHRIPAQGRAQPCGVVAASDRTLAWLPAVWPAPHHAAGGGARAAGR